MTATPTGAPSFRIATRDDVPDLVILVESAYRGESSRLGWTTEADLLDGRRTDARAVLEIVESPAQRVLVAEVGGVLRGCCQLERRPAGVAYFGMFAVDPGHQRGGLGRAILAEAERTASAMWGSTRMHMTVIRRRAELIAWYERRGYRRTGVTSPFPYGDERFGIPVVDDLDFELLVKALPAATAGNAAGGVAGGEVRGRDLSRRDVPRGAAGGAAGGVAGVPGDVPDGI